VILTSRIDPAVAASATALDANAMAVAPLSIETLSQTITTALSHSVILKPTAVYAAVPMVDPPPTTTEKSGASPRGFILNKKADKSAPTAVAAPKPSVKPELELKNVQMRTLANVQPSAVLARDLQDGDGHLLLKAGTQLTASMLERLKDHAKGDVDSYHLWTGELDKKP
jgi:hypothetical protein